MKKLLTVFFFFLFSLSIKAQITLTHNIGTTPIKTDWASCEYDEYWTRHFKLSDFGITTNDQFIIRSGQVAISNSYENAIIGISVLIVDENFPNSVAEYIGGGIAYAPQIGDTPEVVELVFETPIVVPSGANNIIVIAGQLDDIYNPDFRKVLIAGTAQDNDISWFKGCREVFTYIPTEDLSTPVPDANFYINVTGEKLSMTNTSDAVALSHNVADDVIKTDMFSCTSSYLYWARKFILEDFNIGENEELVINKGQVALSEVDWGANIQFNIYKIDENFPASFSESDLIGSSQVKNLPYFTKNAEEARIILVDFVTPVVVPADVEMILVEVHKGITYSDGVAFVAGTAEENDPSWFRGCGGDPSGGYTTTQQLTVDVGGYWTEAFNFYVTVNGYARSIFPFEITNFNNCINFSNDLSLSNQSEIDTVVWDFGDPSSGANNSSTTINNTHQFSSPGIYEIKATVSHTDGNVYEITKEIEIFEAPIINNAVVLQQCDNPDINGFSSFNLIEANVKIINNPLPYTISYFETKIQAENNDTPISNYQTYQNEIANSDIIWARVENANGCFNVSEVNLIISTSQIPSTFSKSFYECDNGASSTDGIATFDFSVAIQDVTDLFPANQQLIIQFYENQANALADENEITNISNYQNTNSPNQQTIYVRVSNALNNDCLGLGGHFTLNVESVPVANPVVINPECDNDRDGLFAFDTSIIQNTIVGSQTNVAVSYTDENGLALPSPLPNPFITASQTITARIINSTSQDPDGQCYEETQIVFTVNNVPIANPVPIQEACDDDFDGIVGFDTSNVESTVLGGQTGLIVKYFDQNNVSLPSPLPNPFFTSSQIIRVRLENPTYDICYEETTIDFTVREKPTFDLIEEGTICITDSPEFTVNIENPSGNHSYTWTDENNIIVSNLPSATFSSGGVYKVIATSAYGCTSDEQEITIIESSVASITIDDIEVIDDTDNNSISITTTTLGIGDYEFRLLDHNSTIIRDYQDQPVFDNLEGGVYTVVINDKNECGTVSFEVSLLSFPKFFSPNADGINDYWTIKGMSRNFYQSGTISVFNRYGKLIKKFTIDDIGWDGTYEGKAQISNDYWYYIELLDLKGITRKKRGNFSLLR